MRRKKFWFSDLLWMLVFPSSFLVMCHSLRASFQTCFQASLSRCLIMMFCLMLQDRWVIYGFFYSALLEVMFDILTSRECRAGIHMCDRAGRFCSMDFIISLWTTSQIREANAWDYSFLVLLVNHIKILQACKLKFLQPVDTFLMKVIQTYEMMMVHHGFIVVGGPFGGKTCTLKVRILHNQTVNIIRLLT